MEPRTSPTLYTARNNGKSNNGGNTTMVTDTTMVNNGMEYGGIWSTFPGFHHGVISDRVGFGERQFTGDVVGHTRDYVNGICPE